MDDSILAIYCLCDDLLKALRHQEDPQRQMRDAEVMTTAVVACREDDDVISALLAMDEHQIRRVPVVNYSGRLVGIISQGDISIRLPPAMQLVRGLGQAA